MRNSNNNYAELKYNYVKNGVTVTEAYLYAYILRWNEVSGKGVSFTSAQIGQELGLTSRIVKNALAGLRSKGYVDQKGRHPRRLWAIVF